MRWSLDIDALSMHLCQPATRAYGLVVRTSRLHREDRWFESGWAHTPKLREIPPMRNLN